MTIFKLQSIVQIGTKPSTDVVSIKGIPESTPETPKDIQQQGKPIAITPFSAVPKDEEKKALAKKKKRKLVKTATKISSTPSAPCINPPQNIILELIQPPTSRSRTQNDVVPDKRKKLEEPISEPPSFKKPRIKITNLTLTNPTQKLTPPPIMSDSPLASDPKQGTPPPIILWPDNVQNDYPIKLFDAFNLPGDDEKFE